MMHRREVPLSSTEDSHSAFCMDNTYSKWPYHLFMRCMYVCVCVSLCGLVSALLQGDQQIEVSTYTNTHTCRHTLFLLWKKMQRSVSWFVKINLFSVYLAKKRQLWTNSLIHQLTAPFLYTYKFLLKRCVFFTSQHAFHFYTYRHAQNFLSQRQLPTLHWNKGEWHLICGVNNY